MKKSIAIVGLGVAGSYLLNRLSREHDVTGYERQKEGQFSAVCLAPESPIITDRGVIPISEVRVGDLVLTHKGRFRHVKQTFSRNFSGGIVKITPMFTNLPVRLTPEHPILISKSNFTEEPSSPEWIPSGEIGDSQHVKLCVSGIAKKEETKPPIHPRIIGYYLAAGSAGLDEVYFYFAKEGQGDLVDDTVSLLKSEGFKCHVEQRATSSAVVTCSQPLAKILKQFGTHSYEKHIPIEYLNLSKQSTIDLLLGLVRGDSCHTKDGICVSTSSLTLAVQVQLLLRTLGIFVSVQMDTPADGDLSVIECRTIQQVHSCYRVDVNGKINQLLQSFGEESLRTYFWSLAEWNSQTQSFLIPIRKYEIENYSGLVYNMEVEDDNSYQTIVGCLHNCAWGTSKHELSKIMEPLGIDFEKYILFNGKEMKVDLGNGKSKEIPLKGLVTFNKHQLELDLTKGNKVEFGVKATPSLLKNKNYDMIIDCTGLHRAFLPKIRDDMWVPCVEYKVNYKDGEMPYEDFFIRPFNQLSGYFWLFPLEKGSAYVGAGDFKKEQNEFVDNFNKDNPGQIEKKIGRPIRISPPKYCEPFYLGNVVGCGESIGTVFPLLGEGIIPSLQCAQLLCENLDDLPAYRKAVLKKFEYFNYVYDIINLKLEGKFSMVRQLPMMLKVYREMKKMEDRFGLEVRLNDFKDIFAAF